MFVCEYIHVYVGANRGQKTVSEPLELQNVVNYLLCVLRTELRSFERSVSTFNC